jgi:hypothetical protein
MILADINLADLMWSLLAFFFFVIILTMVFHIIGDIFRSDDLSGGSKVMWSLFILFVPWLAIFIYLMVRGSGMTERAIKSNQKAQQEFAAYAASVAPSGGSVTEEIASAKQLLDTGAISQPEFDRIKAAALAAA